MGRDGSLSSPEKHRSECHPTLIYIPASASGLSHLHSPEARRVQCHPVKATFLSLVRQQTYSPLLLDVQPKTP
jgi:hypothetical protein